MKKIVEFLNLFIEKTSLKDTRTSLEEIIRSLKGHYLYEGIKRAGWVVGSLELIGSPAGLVRAFGAGLSDLVLLPVAGARRGPGGFISGAAGGAHSLASHVGAAMVKPRFENLFLPHLLNRQVFF